MSPEIGDPALLLPVAIPKPFGWKSDVEKPILLAPHFGDKYGWARKNQEGTRFVNPALSSVDAVLHEIWSSELVLTSSLHVGIVSEAYGIPTVFIKSSELEFKFRDYFLSTGRDFERINPDQGLGGMLNFVAPTPEIPHDSLHRGLQLARTFAAEIAYQAPEDSPGFHKN